MINWSADVCASDLSLSKGRSRKNPFQQTPPVPEPMPASFLFYDLETFGTDPRRSRIAQFAAIRTDAQLHEVEAPVEFFVKPDDDLLPSPMATPVTGNTPQDVLRDGVPEAAAFAPEGGRVGKEGVR